MLGGVNINIQIETPLNKYITLNIIFLLIFVDRYPLNKDPIMLKKPIRESITAAVHSPNTL